MVVLSTNDFSIKDQLRINTVKRWHVVPTFKEQTVADHTCGVMLLGRAIIDEMNLVDYPLLIATFYEMALDHDIPEVLTGDIPSPVKKVMNIDDLFMTNHLEVPANDVSFMAREILGICDTMESILWLGKYGVNTNQVYKCLDGLSRSLKDKILESTIEVREAAEVIWLKAVHGPESWPQDLSKVLGHA